jgi:hypothetical protein
VGGGGRGAHHRQTIDHRAPEHDIIESPSLTHELCSLNRNNRQLQHLADKAITAQFLRDTEHDEFMSKGRDQECDKDREVSTHVPPRDPVYVSLQKAVHWYVPFP